RGAQRGSQRFDQLLGFRLGGLDQVCEKRVALLVRLLEAEARDQLLGTLGDSGPAAVVAAPEPGEAELAEPEEGVQPSQAALLRGHGKNKDGKLFESYRAGQVSAVPVLEVFLEPPLRLVTQ